MRALYSNRAGRRILWGAVAACLATCLAVTVALAGTDSPKPQAAPQPVSIDAALAAFTTAQAYFLKVPGIPGESVDSEHVNEIDVKTMSWGVTNAGGTASGAVISDLTVTKMIDQASPLLMKAAAAGTALGTVVLTAEKNSQSPVTFAVITITGAKVRSFKQTADPSNSFAETDGFSYTSMKLTYFKQKPDGSTTPITGCWNLATHVAC
jgi:type VI secretion system secreted protein Hcp